MAPGIKALRLPSMAIPHLFQPEKFVPASDPSGQVVNARRGSSAHLRDTLLVSAAERQRAQDPSNFTAVQAASIAPTTPPSPLDYKMALQSTQIPPSVRSSSSVKPPKHVLDPTKPLSKRGLSRRRFPGVVCADRCGMQKRLPRAPIFTSPNANGAKTVNTVTITICNRTILQNYEPMLKEAHVPSRTKVMV
jgi:hypothetical protein